MRFVVYIILFILGYRVLKKFFSPTFGEINDASSPNSNPYQHSNHDSYSARDRNDDVEDIEYEELD